VRTSSTHTQAMDHAPAQESPRVHVIRDAQVATPSWRSRMGDLVDKGEHRLVGLAEGPNHEGNDGGKCA